MGCLNFNLFSVVAGMWIKLDFFFRVFPSRGKRRDFFLYRVLSPTVPPLIVIAVSA